MFLLVYQMLAGSRCHTGLDLGQLPRRRSSSVIPSPQFAVDEGLAFAVPMLKLEVNLVPTIVVVALLAVPLPLFPLGMELATAKNLV